MGVLLWRKHAKNIIVFMYRLTVIAPFLLVPPVGVGISELTGDPGGVDVAPVHVGIVDVGFGEIADLWAVGEGFDGGAQELGKRSRRCEAPSEHLHSINMLEPSFQMRGRHTLEVDALTRNAFIQHWHEVPWPGSFKRGKCQD